MPEQHKRRVAIAQTAPRNRRRSEFEMQMLIATAHAGSVPAVACFGDFLPAHDLIALFYIRAGEVRVESEQRVDIAIAVEVDQEADDNLAPVCADIADQNDFAISHCEARCSRLGFEIPSLMRSARSIAVAADHPKGVVE